MISFQHRYFACIYLILDVPYIKSHQLFTINILEDVCLYICCYLYIWKICFWMANPGFGLATILMNSKRDVTIHYSSSDVIHIYVKLYTAMQWGPPGPLAWGTWYEPELLNAELLNFWCFWTLEVLELLNPGTSGGSGASERWASGASEASEPWSFWRFWSFWTVSFWTLGQKLLSTLRTLTLCSTVGNRIRPLAVSFLSRLLPCDNDTIPMTADGVTWQSFEPIGNRNYNKMCLVW